MARRPDEFDEGYAYVPSSLGNSSSDPYSASSHSPYDQGPSLQPPAATNPTSITTFWADPQPTGHQAHPFYNASQHHHEEPVSPESPIDPAALQFALPPNIFQTGPNPVDPGLEPPSADAFAAISTAYYDDHSHFDVGGDSDRIPLTASAEPISGALDVPSASAQARDSFQTVSDLEGGQQARDSRMLGYDLDPGYAAGGRQRSYGSSLAPDSAGRRSRATSTSGALQKTASIMRAMSQRVVDISGGGEALEQQALRDRSRSPSADGRRSHHLSNPMMVNTSYQPHVFATPLEKKGESEFTLPQPPPLSEYRPPMPNPLRGKSLGIFSADNPLRLWLCDLLMLPWVESVILVLIVLQAILLAVEAAPDVWSPGNARPDRWGKTPYDWAMLGLFVVFTIEIIVRIIVSGFIFNAADTALFSNRSGNDQSNDRQ
ncbi:calcium channel protein [Sporothrix eucalyptigena]|uniref:Calcium channel protein n=1 Tax=Sporothrix eucalyptigena TaxID=1812306 RepID=A0ABP0CVM3_9PEZI